MPYGLIARTLDTYSHVLPNMQTEATELGSGQPFLRFFHADREGHERGVLSVELRERR
jgi:hypothetical protein